jgi:hypothetical protein
MSEAFFICFMVSCLADCIYSSKFDAWNASSVRLSCTGEVICRPVSSVCGRHTAVASVCCTSFSYSRYMLDNMGASKYF